MIKRDLVAPAQREQLVADLTLVGRIQAIVVFAAGAILAAGLDAVVAGNTVTGEAGVIHRRTQPGGE